MPTYIVLGKWTSETFHYRKSAPTAVQEVRLLVQKLGAEIKGWYTLLGRFDEICILEAPDDATITRIVLAVGERFGIRTETMRAFDIDEAVKLMTAKS
jgi:uncharacterized protein with GYD domain